jgi:hypothetical protein
LVLDHRALPYFIRYLDRFSKQPAAETLDINPLVSEMMHTDLEALEESCMAIETLALDSETARAAMASDTVMKPLVQFIEADSYPSTWSKTSTSEQQTWKKSFDTCKAALITALTSVTGDDRNSGILWNDHVKDSARGITTGPISWFASKMFGWISSFSAVVKTGADTRDDLVICGTLCTGNLAREGEFFC